MMARFFVDDRLKAGTMAFEGAEFHHMVRVTRHQVGDTVRLFDGKGREANAKIEFVSRHAATLKVGKVETVPEETGPQLVIAAAMPKASRSAWLVEKAVELGVKKIIPLKTARSVVDPRRSKLDTLQQNIISASKQSGRSRLMEIGDVTSWSDFLAKMDPANITTVAHPGGAPFSEGLVDEMIAEQSTAKKKSGSPTVVVAIGPEGGFTVEEITQAATRGARLVSLGPRILRVETAVMMTAAVFTAAQMHD